MHFHAEHCRLNLYHKLVEDVFNNSVTCVIYQLKQLELDLQLWPEQPSNSNIKLKKKKRV